MKTKLSMLTVALTLALAAPGALAMGLGQMQVKSGLNQPLVAEIAIISATPSELDTLEVSLASPEAFARVGLDRPYDMSSNLQFSVGKNAAGQPVIRVTTQNKFAEPLLSFLIEVDWGKGTVTREYTALIDPPYIAAAVIRPMQGPTTESVAIPAPVEAVASPETSALIPPMPESAQTMPAPESAAAIVTQAAPEPSLKPPPRRQPVQAPVPLPAPTNTGGEYGPVSNGQTLWSIAASVRTDTNSSVNQVMVALLRANPTAFADDNINLLKRGSVLRIPTQDEITRLSAEDAAMIVREQASAWRAPRASVPQPAQTATATTQSSSPPRATAAPPKQTSRLEITPPSGKPAASGTQSGAVAGGRGKELRAEISQAREDLAARTSEVGELKSRISDLEKQGVDRQRLIDMQSSQLNDLQNRLKQMQAEQASATALAGAASVAVATPATVAEPVPVPVPDKAAPVAPAPEPDPWYFNPFILGGGVLVMVGGLALGMRRKKPKTELAEPGPSRRISEDEALRASFANTRMGAAMPRQEPTASVPAEPVTEAEPADHELEAVTQAVRARPQDLETHLALLRLHHLRGDAVDYEKAAQAMRLQVHSTMDPRWREAVVMGASLMPGHALFSQAGWNVPRFNGPEPVSRVPEPEKMAPEPAFIPEPVSFQPVSPEPEPVMETIPEPVKDDMSFDFDMVQQRDSNAAPEHLEFTLPDDEPELEAEPEPQVISPFTTAEMALTGDFAEHALSRDIHRNEAQLMEEDETSATRIELAKAYLDIGDLDGARSMLEEVLAEGGPAARAEAQNILKEIG